MLNLDCAHFFSVCVMEKNQITIYNFINLTAATFHVRLSMRSFFVKHASDIDQAQHGCQGKLETLSHVLQTPSILTPNLCLT